VNQKLDTARVFERILEIYRAQLLIAPLSAVAASVMFFELKAMRGEPVLAPTS
jgi:hypothetical protein